MCPGIPLDNANNHLKVKIDGDSMNPSMHHGDEFIFEKYFNQKVRLGDILLFSHPYSKKNLVKRVTKIKEGDEFFLEGDNPNYSSDSRSFGFISKKKIIAINKNHDKQT